MDKKVVVECGFLLLCSPDDVQSIISGKLALRYSGSQVRDYKRSTSFYLRIQCIGASTLTCGCIPKQFKGHVGQHQFTYCVFGSEITL